MNTNSKQYESLESANSALTEIINSNSLFFLSRAGATETAAIEWYSLNSPLDHLKSIKRRVNLWRYSGVFPPTIKQLANFQAEYSKALFHSDFHVDFAGESVFNLLNMSTKLKPFFPLEILDPVLLASRGIKPWSMALEGKKILVVHPQSFTILKQSQNIAELHRVPVLGKCEIKSLAPPQTNGLSISRNLDWKFRLDFFKTQIDEHLSVERPDLALVAAGAYGLPICSYVKERGISSIYVGGALQILFGIWGSRWRGKPEYEKIATNNWVNSSENKVFGSKFIEKGAYW